MGKQGAKATKKRAVKVKDLPEKAKTSVKGGSISTDKLAANHNETLVSDQH